MGISTAVQYRILKKISPGEPHVCSGGVYEGKSKLKILVGEDFFSRIAGKTVIDFGCGEGCDAVEMAQDGAGNVIGLDIREDVLRVARERAARAGAERNCNLVTSTNELADVIVSLDAFEHFGNRARLCAS